VTSGAVSVGARLKRDGSLGVGGRGRPVGLLMEGDGDGVRETSLRQADPSGSLVNCSSGAVSLSH